MLISAYDALVSRYENKSLIIQSHIRSLFNSPKVVHPCANSLRKLHHHIVSHVNALRSLQQPVDHWDAWLVTLICCSLDSTTVGEWQLKQMSKNLPSYIAIEQFLSDRVAAYEVGDISSQCNSASAGKATKQRENVGVRINEKHVFAQSLDPKYAPANRVVKIFKCNLCSGPHRVINCDQYLQRSINDRQAIVFKHRLCYNCLFFGHQVRLCRSPPCSKCSKRHHVSLHEESEDIPDVQEVNPAVLVPELNNTAMYSETFPQVVATAPVSNVMLGTAVICIRSPDGILHHCRAVLDSGAQINFITSEYVRKLQLNICETSIPIVGIGSARTHTNSVVQATIESKVEDYKVDLSLHVLPVITNLLPSHHIDTNQLIIPDLVKANLADPLYDVPNKIDMLLGAGIFYDLLNNERVRVSSHAVFISTKLGWLLTGEVPIVYSTKKVACHVPVVNSALALFSTKFDNHTKEEQVVEQHFLDTFTRDKDGRFIVRLPLSKSPDILGDSRYMAIKRLISLERRLAKDSYLSQEYAKFIAEYIALGHMHVVPSEEVTKPAYYLPHHAVIKHNSLTTKVRVVFDGSAPSNSGTSLNDILSRGPTVQPDLRSILLRFRVHNYVITADIEKMYRQVKVSPLDCDLQRIVFRPSPEEPITDYRLSTVTYGTKSASYLATKCLSHLSNDTSSQACSRVIREDFYVDDLITGSTTEEGCYALYSELCTVLSNAGMLLRKWCSSSKKVFDKIEPALKADSTYLLNLSENDTVSALGLAWQPGTDSFKFSFKPWSPPAIMTKRTLLSDMNRIYDPIGLISPVLIKGKIFLQQLWTLKLDWDMALSSDLQLRWTQFYTGVKALENIVIPRRIINSSIKSIQIHGFCDASQEAFGACLYIRSVDHNGACTSVLFTSKSRVAPLQPSTIPRLELCGALLLSELMHDVLSELEKLDINIPSESQFLWSDSSIVIAWINTDQRLKSYVANRIAKILDNTQPHQWRHVKSHENPADLISRGISADKVSNKSLWWHGPDWLVESETKWPNQTVALQEDLPETNPVKFVLIVSDQPSYVLDRYSDWIRLIRITAWLRRFKNLSRKIVNGSYHNNSLTVAEIQGAQTCWIAYAQANEFHSDISALQLGKPISSKSKLKCLNPFLDDSGIIRVGGRLSNSSLPFNRRHPILLPSKGKITRLIFEYEHKRLFHVGPQALLSSIHQRYWPIRGRSRASTVVHNCVRCSRHDPKLLVQYMAPLPKSRVTVERPFARCGVDFCGPIFVKSGIRRVSALKAYISVFVCFVTRAVHLELVMGLTTDAFLAALKRFMSRRGQCLHITSDNGTNFVGAHKELQAYFKSNKVQDSLSTMGIEWHFIPPGTPHFGGLWEAAVKSAKRLLYKVTNGALFSYEETTTFLCQVEAILNSRPLTPLSTDPSDLNALTPAHFLIGGVLTCPPEPDAGSTPDNRLKRWELVKKQTQQFWNRWHSEYLPQMQKRGRWLTPGKKISVGDLAILRNEAASPMKWPLVRVVHVHPGADGIIRVVTIRNQFGHQFKRPVVKLSLIPTTEDEDF